jgi:oxygen-independent coproporphyrinogen-3 oxidase
LSGIYLHIPFCKQACYYCDFHFSTNTTFKKKIVEAMCKEIELQKYYLSEPLKTIYFGGGTPSMLSEEELEMLLSYIYKNFSTEKELEITLEANPDDLTENKLKSLQKSGINRLSIGIQSFDDQHLKTLNRAHHSEEAINCVLNAQNIGFNNITIDLIYAIPSPNHEVWQKDLEKAISLNVPHISAYCLTIEKKTVLGNWTKKKKFTPSDDEFAAVQFEMLVDTLVNEEYEHYEISNFALPHQYSTHNTNYWKGVHYVGIGASAHSYNGNSRQYNVRNNAHYLQSIELGKIPCEIEILSKEDKLNEYIMTSLRTQWGCNVNYLKQNLSKEKMNDIEIKINQYIQRELLVRIDEKLILTFKGKLLADRITEELFIIS